MLAKQPLEHSNGLVDQAAASAGHAIKSTQRITHDALEALSDGVQDMRDKTAPLLHRSGDQIGALTRRGVEGVRPVTRRRLYVGAPTVPHAAFRMCLLMEST